MEKMMETPFVDKVDDALRKIDFQINPEEKDLFIKYLYQNHLCLYHYEFETYPKYFGFLYKTIIKDL
jgi:hypothetical protein